MSKRALPTDLPRERAILVGIELRTDETVLSVEDSLHELELLADTAGLAVVGKSIQRLNRPDPKTFIGSGKVEEVVELIRDRAAEIVVFDEELSPRHQRELENIFKDQIRVIDRTALILDIFAQHAQTREGALQVELAQYEYRLPRLTRAWTHLARQAGGGGGRAGSVGGVGLRGPGETQLEVDRQEIGRRITQLKKALEKVRAHRKRYRVRRRKAEIPTVAIVGYTNAGKSTLINTLADADVLVADQLFATLDPTTRRVELPAGRVALITDTVGFIQKLPTMLVAAFRATLEEIVEADLILHVIDITHSNYRDQARAVLSTLHEIGAHHLSVVTALNKIDVLKTQDRLIEAVDQFDRAVPISALRGDGIQILLTVIENELYEQLLSICVRIPYREGQRINLFHEAGVIQRIEHGAEEVLIEGRIPAHLRNEFHPYEQVRDVKPD